MALGHLTWAMALRRVSAEAKLIAIYLANGADTDSWAYADVAELAEWVGIKAYKVRREIQWLNLAFFADSKFTVFRVRVPDTPGNDGDWSLSKMDPELLAVPVQPDGNAALRREAERFFDEQFWPAYPKRFGSNPKEPARKKIVALIVKGEKPKEILDGVRRLYSALEKSDKVGTEFVPMALTWINRKQWRDDPMPEGNPSANKATSFFEIAAGKW